MVTLSLYHTIGSGAKTLQSRRNSICLFWSWVL